VQCTTEVTVSVKIIVFQMKLRTNLWQVTKWSECPVWKCSSPDSVDGSRVMLLMTRSVYETVIAVSVSLHC